MNEEFLLRSHADVCMIVKNQLWNDARVKKEAQTLSDMGLGVTIISQPEDDSPDSEVWNGIRVLRVPVSGGFKASLRKMLDSSGSSDKKDMEGFVSAMRRNTVKRFIGDFLHSTLYQVRLLHHALGTGARVYHAHDLDTLAVCAAAAWITGGKFIYDAHELWLESNRHLLETSRPFMKLETFTESFLAPLADAVIAVTPGRANVMREMYPTLTGPDLVPNYPPLAPAAPRLQEVRRKLGVRSDPCFLFLYQGILGLHRGLEQLVDASVMLRDLPIHVAFVGHDRSGGAVKRYAEKRNVEDMVTFHPPVPSEELPRITGSADSGLVLFQGSCLNHALSLPNKLFEYMMAGLPVIACDLPEIASVINKHDCGVLVDASDPASIADAMRRTALDPAEAKARGVRGYEAARTFYTWNKSAEALKELYSRVLGEAFSIQPGNGEQAP